MYNMEVQIYMLTPETGKYYKTANYTRKTGVYPHELYFTTEPLRYIGKFMRGISEDGNHYDIFDKNGTVEIVHYSYWGTTGFVEVAYEGTKVNNK